MRHLLLYAYTQTHTQKLTADDEVGIEDAQGGLISVLLVIDGGGDDEAKGDAGDTLQHNQSYNQHYGAFIRDLHRGGKGGVGWRDGIDKAVRKQNGLLSFLTGLGYFHAHSWNGMAEGKADSRGWLKF